MSIGVRRSNFSVPSSWGMACNFAGFLNWHFIAQLHRREQDNEVGNRDATTTAAEAFRETQRSRVMQTFPGVSTWFISDAPLVRIIGQETVPRIWEKGQNFNLLNSSLKDMLKLNWPLNGIFIYVLSRCYVMSLIFWHWALVGPVSRPKTLSSEARDRL